MISLFKQNIDICYYKCKKTLFKCFHNKNKNAPDWDRTNDLVINSHAL